MKILIVDDHPLFSDALMAMIYMILPESQVFHADSCGAAIEISHHSVINLCFLDLTLKDSAGIETLKEFRERAPSTPTVVVSAIDNRDVVNSCLLSGAMGFVPKTVTRDELINATRTVLSGKIFVPDVAANSKSLDVKVHLSDLGLSLRQQQVFRAVLRGKPNKVISQELGIAESTIKKHVSPALKALGVVDRIQAIIKLAENGIVVD